MLPGGAGLPGARAQELEGLGAVEEVALVVGGNGLTVGVEEEESAARGEWATATGFERGREGGAGDGDGHEGGVVRLGLLQRL